MTLISVSHVYKSVQDTTGTLDILRDIDFQLDAQQSLAIVGASGSGKSTLLSIMAGLDTPSQGTVVLSGQDLFALSEDQRAAWRARHIGFVFQSFQLMAHMTALENVMVGAHLRLDRNLFKAALRWPSLRRRDNELREEAAELMKFVGLESYIHARSDAMSYGVLKRLEIARALAMKPRVIFLDEPAAGLNPKETIEIDHLVRKLADSGITVVLVEHDMKMVMNLSDRILVLDYGKKLTEGTCAEVRKNPDVIAAYLGAHA